jgi:hypothetical protein
VHNFPLRLQRRHCQHLIGCFKRQKLRAKNSTAKGKVGGRTLSTGFISSHESEICLGSFSLSHAVLEVIRVNDLQHRMVLTVQ